MCKENSACIVEPQKGKKDPAIGETVFFCMNPAEANRYCAVAEKRQGKRHFLFNSNLWQLPVNCGGSWVCGPAVGAPMAVLVLEQLIALGGSSFVLYGTCGSLSEKLCLGDVLLPVTALSEEGTSAHYPLPAPPASSPLLRQQLVRYLDKSGISTSQGEIWTTDAPYRETKEKVSRYGKQGVVAVDMEFSALISVAAFRKVELAAVMVVSDLLWGDKWQPGFANKKVKAQNAAVGHLLLDFCGRV